MAQKRYNNQNGSDPGSPLLILSVAIIILVLVSFAPLSKISGGKLKDYNLLADLSDKPAEIVVNTETYIDPDLLEMTQNFAEEDLAENVDSVPLDIVMIDAIEDSAANEVNNVQEQTSEPEPVHTFAPISRNPDESQIQVDEPEQLRPVIPTGNGQIEDYTPNGTGFKNLKRALSNGQLARIAVIGDSYIEGDIFTQDVREKLQELYSGGGVGYVPASSSLTGFRQSVTQSCSGWKEFDFRKAGKNYPTLQGFYYSPAAEGMALTTYKGSKRKSHAAEWDRSRVLFIAPTDLTINVSTDNGDESFNIEGSEEVQQILVNGNTSKFKISASNSSLIVLGVYLDKSVGIAVDNMSIRGYSGIKHSTISPDLAAQMRRFVDYDVIVVEYGTNALSSVQKDYSAYIKMMERAINNIRQCYPNADILVMGIGDRGEKAGTEIRSMPVVTTLVESQRNMARRLGVLFWDTRAAMGGENSVVDWARTGHVNKDYIHLSGKGGERLSRLFVESLNNSLND